MGAKVFGYSLAPKNERDNFVLLGGEKQVSGIIADIRDIETLKKTFSGFKPEIVFHLAAQPLVLESYSEPYGTFDVNFRGTLNILEVFRNDPNSRTLVCITTDKVYQNNEWYWGYRETDTLGGNDPYSASKASCELLINSYTKSFFHDSAKSVASVRAGNVIGGGDWAEFRIVPDFFRSLENGEELILRNPTAVRPWQFVLEPLYGYLTLAKKMFTDGMQFQCAWNFGPERDKFVDVEGLIQTLIQVNKQGSYSIVENSSGKKEAGFLFLDSMKAYKLLHWESKLSFEESLKLTSDWYLGYSNRSVRDICTDQIKFYESLWK